MIEDSIINLIDDVLSDAFSKNGWTPWNASENTDKLMAEKIKFYFNEEDIDIFKIQSADKNYIIKKLKPILMFKINEIGQLIHKLGLKNE